MNNTLLIIFAKFWDTFKQNNPITAAIVYVASVALITLSTISPDYGIGLPKWVAILVTVASAIIGGANGSRTSQILGRK